MKQLEIFVMESNRRPDDREDSKSKRVCLPGDIPTDHFVICSKCCSGNYDHLIMKLENILYIWYIFLGSV